VLTAQKVGRTVRRMFLYKFFALAFVVLTLLAFLRASPQLAWSVECAELACRTPRPPRSCMLCCSCCMLNLLIELLVLRGVLLVQMSVLYVIFPPPAIFL
jgi:hypothetical protein